MYNNSYKVTPSELMEAISKCIKNKETLLIKGPPGVGKTSIVEQAVCKLKYKFIPMYPSISTATDFVGQPVYDRDEKKAMFVPYDKLEKIITADEPTVVLLDDFGQAQPSIQAACMHLLSERRIGFNKVSDNVTFIIATNDRGQQAGVHGVLEPIKSRCLSILEVNPDVNDWVSYAIGKGLREEVIAFIRFRPELLNSFSPTTELTNSPSPRTNEHVSKIISMDLSENLEISMIAGAVGKSYAVEFIPFKKLFEDMVSPQSILDDPDGFKIDMERPDLIFAYCAAIAKLANRQNVGNVIRFASKLPPEYGFKLVEYDMHSKESLKETSAYISWAVDNQDMFKL